MQDVRWIPYCGEAPTPDVWLGRWNLDPVLLVALGAAALWLWHRPSAPDAAGRRLALRSAWALTVALYVSPLCALSSAFFTVRVVHHMALVLLIAPMLAYGMRRGAVWRGVPTPPLAASTALAAVVFWAWHLPAPYEAALSSTPVYWLMQLTLLASAFAFWSAVRRAGTAAALAAILATTVQMGLLGALITFASRPLYAPHLASTLGWGVSPLEDQQLAGIVMWAPGSFAYLLAAVWIGWHGLVRPRARAA
jgi:putative membrane protein